MDPKDEIVVESDLWWDARLAALYAKRRELGRNELTKEERAEVIEEVLLRLKNGEEAFDLMREYGDRYQQE